MATGPRPGDDRDDDGDGRSVRDDEGGAHVDLHRRAAVLGTWCWLERRLFELLGRWATVEADPTVAVFLADMSARHAWHARVWFDRLPVLADLDPEALVVPAGPGTEALVGGLSAHGDAEATVERLAAVHRCVLPALVVRYREVLAGASPVAEGALHRWGALVVADDLDEWVRGEELLRAATAEQEPLRRALSTQAATEEALLASASLTR